MRRLLLLLPLGSVLASGCSSHKAQSAEAPPPPVAAHTAVVTAGAVPATLLLSGTLKANQESELAANASGQVTRTMVERGSYVTRGQALAQLDVRMAQLSANEASANVESARVQKAAAQEDCSRYQKLFDKAAISSIEFDKQMTSCKTAAISASASEARAAQSAQTLANGTIRAPFGGLVSERYVSVGEYVQPQTKVAHIVDIDTLRLELTVPEQNIAAIHEGQTVAFHVDAFPGKTFEGIVHYIGPAVRASTRDLVFEALVPNKDKTLRPGLFATAQLDVGTQTLPLVPKTAVRTDGDTSRVFVVANGHAEERIVQLGPAQGESTSILQGVKAGERFIDKPAQQISDGVEVK